MTTTTGHDSSGSGDPAHPPMHGARVGRYLVIEQVGRGGMGVVLRAYDPKLQREVALKRVRTDTLDDSAQARLVREARAMARLSHPNVVSVYDVDLDGGVSVVMELVPGTTLARWLEEEPRPWRASLTALVAAGRGLAAAHAEGLLHRDFKLDNVLVGKDGRVRVTDFGLARPTDVAVSRIDDPLDPRGSGPDPADSPGGDDDDTSGLTVAGFVMGTPAYMAPEQLRGAEVDERTDQYALCAAAWRALTGGWPFTGAGTELARAKLRGPGRWPGASPVPGHVIEAIRRGLAPDPGARWPSVPALLEELERDPSRQRRRWIAVGAVGMATAATLGTQRIQGARAVAACAEEARRIEDHWNAERDAAIETTFADSGIRLANDTWSRSRGRLHTYAARWSAARAEVCERAEIAGTMARALADAARACLDEHVDDLDALLEQLERPDTTVVHETATAIASLPRVETCTDERHLRQRSSRPEDPGDRSRIRALRSRLSRASIAAELGRSDEALALASGVHDEAEALGWHPLMAEAQLALGHAYERHSRMEDAAAAFAEAFYLAEARARDEVALEAASSAVRVVGHYLGRHDEGLQWGRLARMLIDRLDLGDDFLEATLLNNLALVDRAKGAYDEAKASSRRAWVLRERALGPDHPLVGQSHNNLALVHTAAGEHEQALVLFERGLERWIDILGPDHPDVATILNNMGVVHANRGDHTAARALHQRAWKIWEASAPGHLRAAHTLELLGRTHAVLGERDDARVAFSLALEIRERATGPDHPDLAFSLAGLAEIALTEERFEEATDLARRASSLLDGRPGASQLAARVRELSARALDEQERSSGRAGTGPSDRSQAPSMTRHPRGPGGAAASPAAP
jgi:eukaryotic-like serine/threonine-protein kinase